MKQSRSELTRAQLHQVIAELESETNAMAKVIKDLKKESSDAFATLGDAISQKNRYQDDLIREKKLRADQSTIYEAVTKALTERNERIAYLERSLSAVNAECEQLIKRNWWRRLFNLDTTIA
ncbi:MAG: hypothetical protein SNH18_10380 [Rikenellaceae bacterium]